jgi:hypothetical protein
MHRQTGLPAAHYKLTGLDCGASDPAPMRLQAKGPPLGKKGGGLVRGGLAGASDCNHNLLLLGGLPT